METGPSFRLGNSLSRGSGVPHYYTSFVEWSWGIGGRQGKGDVWEVEEDGRPSAARLRA